MMVIKISDVLLVMLYIITLGVIVIGFGDLIVFASVLLLIIIIVLFERIRLERNIADVKIFSDSKRREAIDIITQRLASFSQKLEELKNEFQRSMFNVSTRISETRLIAEREMESQYRDLARKILEVENRAGEVRKNLSIVYSSMDERLRRMERE